jgi:AcrR family transcriptional regulator
MVAPNSDAVKRRYRSPLREEQARRTRRAVVDAAAELFLDRGYAATTVEAIADLAGVNRRTFFTSVGGKAEALKLAIDWANVGDDEPIPMLERPHVRAALASQDAPATLRLFASDFVEIASRNAGLLAVVDDAADADPAVRSLADELQRQRITGMTAIATILKNRRALRPDLTVDQAADVLFCVASPGNYQWMILRRRWPARRFAEWLGDTLVSLLVVPGS